jgi:hypothetical protein
MADGGEKSTETTGAQLLHIRHLEVQRPPLASDLAS